MPGWRDPSSSDLWDKAALGMRSTRSSRNAFLENMGALGVRSHLLAAGAQCHFKPINLADAMSLAPHQ